MTPELWVLNLSDRSCRCFLSKAPPAARTYPYWHWVGVAWERLSRQAETGALPPPGESVADLYLRSGVLACVDDFRATSHFRSKLEAFASLDDILADAGGEVFAAPPECPDPRDRLAALWADTRAARLRSVLSVRQRVRLYLWAVEGWTLAEIAAFWGCTKSAVSYDLAPVLRGKGSARSGNWLPSPTETRGVS